MKRAGPEELYLDLLKKCLTRTIFPALYQLAEPRARSWRAIWTAPLRRLLSRRGLVLVRGSSEALRREGNDWPADAETMVGLKRLDNVQQCIRTVLDSAIPGDLMEAGVWRGGVSIFMRGALEAYGDAERNVWAADSFEGLPPPSPEEFPADAEDEHWRQKGLAVGLEEVKTNFLRYGLLDERVRFLKGWFKDTLPTSPVEMLSVLRIDADMYESTYQVLETMYPKVSSGGFVIIDDYFSVEGCRRAVQDFRSQLAIREELTRIDSEGAFWRKGLPLDG